MASFLSRAKGWLEGNAKFVAGVLISGVALGVTASVLMRRPRKETLVEPEPDQPDTTAAVTTTTQVTEHREEEQDDHAADDAKERALEWIGPPLERGLPQILMVHSMKLNHSMQLGEQEFQDPLSKRLHEQVQGQMKTAYWAVFNEKMQDGDYSVLTAEIEALTATLLELDPSPPHQQSLAANLDKSLITQMVAQQAFSAQQFGNLVTFLTDEVKALGDPKNRPKIEEFKNKIFTELSCEGNVDMVKVLPEVIAFLSDTLRQIKIDQANKLLRWLQPVVERQGVEIERDFVQEAEKNQLITFTKTAEWLRKNCNDADPGDHQVRLAVRRGIMLLCSSDVAACANQEYPESLFLDTHHIQGLQNEIHLIVLTASCIYQIRETISNASKGLGVWPPSATQVEELKNAVMQSLSSPIQPMAQLQMVATKFAVNCFHLAKVEMSPEDVKRYTETVAANAASIALPENPVVPLLKKRLEKSMMTALVNVEDVDIIDSMKKVPANKCFATFDEQIQKAFDKIVAICNLNFAVFYGRYRDLLLK